MNIFKATGSLLSKALNTRQVGRRGEDITIRYLKREGMKILGRNYQVGRDEFDVIAREGNCLVFVEVKTSRGEEFGDPAEWITSWKKRRMIRSAQRYLRGHNYDGNPVRFDVVIVKTDSGGIKVEHYRDAFSAEFPT